jgi:hypothetical protein
MTKKLTAQIAAAYMPCGIMVDGKPRKLVGIDWAENGMYLADYPDENCESLPVWRYEGGFEDCQLILKPLSEISDEDAVWLLISRIILYDIHVHIEKCSIKNGIICIEWTALNYDAKMECQPVSQLNTKQTDYLRSKSYDLGYGDIPSLIEAGIAIVEPRNEAK